MVLYKRGKIWWLAFSHNGKRVSKSTKCIERRAADRWVTSYFKAIGQQGDGLFNVDCTLAEALNRYMDVHLKVKNFKSYTDSRYKIQIIYKKIPPETPLSKLRPLVDEYRAWRMQCKAYPKNKKSNKTISPATVNREISIIRSAVRKALEWNMISHDPLAGLKLAKLNNRRVRFIEDEEFQRLMNAAHPALAPIILIARHTGMRQGEILNLEWKDIDLRRGWLSIRQSKNGEGRFVPMTGELIDLFSKTPLSEREGFIFKRHGVRMVRDGWLRDQFTKAVKQAGLINFHFHDLRHTFASHAAMRGADVQTIAAFLGHKTLRMTQRYSHLSAGHLKVSIELAAPRKPQPTATKVLQSETDPIEPQTYPNKNPAISGEVLSGALVEVKGLEPSTSSLRTMRSPS